MLINSLRTNFVGKIALLRTFAKTALKAIGFTFISLMNANKVNRMTSRVYKTICSSRSYRMSSGHHNLLSTISLRNPFLGKARELLHRKKRIRKKSAVFPVTLGAIPLLDHAKELLHDYSTKPDNSLNSNAGLLLCVVQLHAHINTYYDYAYMHGAFNVPFSHMLYYYMHIYIS